MEESEEAFAAGGTGRQLGTRGPPIRVGVRCEVAPLPSCPLRSKNRPEAPVASWRTTATLLAQDRPVVVDRAEVRRVPATRTRRVVLGDAEVVASGGDGGRDSGDLAETVQRGRKKRGRNGKGGQKDCG